MCEYHQTSPESSIQRRRLCTLATPEGRITFSDRRPVLVTQNGKREERLLRSEEEGVWC